LYYGCPSDISLSFCLDIGAIPDTKLTSHDVYNNRLLRGPCVHCLAGKKKARSYKPSTTPPAPRVAHTLCMDCTKLKVPSSQGNTHEITCVDERSGRIDVVGSPSKTTADLFSSVWSLIKRYNGYGHVVEFLYVDAEQSLVALGPYSCFPGAAPAAYRATHANPKQPAHLSVQRNSFCITR